jgi:uncharacterized repeat protein (TIGR01451 family)
LNFLQNRRLVTLALLGVTLIFGGIAIYLAITIVNRQINPDDTSALSKNDPWELSKDTYNCRYHTGGGECAVAQFQDGACDHLKDGEMCFCRGGDTQSPTGTGWTYAKVDKSKTTPNCLKKSVEEICAARSTGGLIETNDSETSCTNIIRCAPKAPPVTTQPPTTTPQEGKIRINTVCTDGSIPSGSRFDLNVTVIAANTGATVGNSSGSLNVGSGRDVDVSGSNAFPVFANLDAKNINNGLFVSRNGCDGRQLGSGGSCTLEFNGCNTPVTNTPPTSTPPTNTPPVTTITTTPPPAPINLTCTNLAITTTAGVAVTGTQLTPGTTYRLQVSSSNNPRFGTRYSYKIGNGAYTLIPNPDQNPTHCATKGNNFNDNYNPTYVNFTVPASAAGQSISFRSANVFKVVNNTLTAQPASACPDNDNSSNIVTCGAPSATWPTGSKAMRSATGYNLDPAAVNAQFTALNVTCTGSSACEKAFTVITPPSQCTGLTVTNTRTGTSCNSTNPANCQVRQGDTVNVSITGSGTVTGYSAQTVRNPGATVQNFTTQASSSFNGINVPATSTLTSFDIRGFTSNGIATTGGTGPCNIRFSFTNNPTVNKDINSGGSSGLTGNNVVTTGSVVEYDVSVANQGTSVLQNVLVYDRLIPIVNGVASSAAPFGNVLTATNLSRTTGTLSTPNPVTPLRGYTTNTVPFSGSTVTGGTYTNAQGIKLVLWNKITSFRPTEAYTGKVRVQIGDYTGNPVLRNYVCIVVDSNNNNQPDAGELTRCSYEDVNTSNPTFTVAKTASDTTVAPGGTVTYTLTLRNTSGSPLSLSDVTVTDTFDAAYVGRVTITPQNGGERAGNIITWTGSDLVAINNGGTTLAAGGTLAMTVQVQFNSDFFDEETVCTRLVDNSVVARSTTPDYTTPASPVQIAVNNELCETEPVPTSLPGGGINTSLYLPIGSLAAVVIGLFLLRAFTPWKKLRNQLGSKDNVEELRNRIRGRKK